jgi:hypothetical protein
MGIKRFLLRLLLFSLVAFPFVTFRSLYAYYTKSYESTVYGSEIYVSVKKSKVKKKVKILIIGDSIGKQLYDNDTYNNDIYSEACNQAISMAGYYILLKNFIENNKNELPGKVLLIITPETFTNNLDQVYSYHYFLKPFYKAEYKKYFTPVCYEQIRKIPFYYTSQSPFILNTNWSPTYNTKKDTSFRFISPVSHDYLIKIKSLCVDNHIAFGIYGPPVKMANKNEIVQYSKSVNEFEKSGLKNELTTYFKNIEFLPDSLFQDHIHFKKQYIPADYFKLGQN